MTNLIIYTLLAGVGGTGLGGIIGAILNRDSTKSTSLLLSLAGGIMLSIVFFDLVPESINHAGIWYSIFGIIGGAIIIYILNTFIDISSKKKNEHLMKNHPDAHDDLDELMHSDTLITEIEEKASSKKIFQAGLIMVLAIAFHNFPEGLAIGSSYVHNASVGITFGILIGLHNIPEGMAVSVPLISGGMKKWKAVLLTAFTGLPTTLGAILGYFIGDLSDLSLGVSLGLAAGAMMIVVFADMIPESILLNKSRWPAILTMLGIIIGIILINVI